MIVTRQRPKPRQVHKVILPVLAIVLLALVFILPQSRNVVMNGPLAPMWRTLNTSMTTVAQPFHFASLNNQITARDRTIAQLQTQINTDKLQISDRDRQITSLQSQLNTAMQQNVTAKSVVKAPAAAASPGAFSGAAGGSDLAATATPDMRRTANQWAAMDAESAAKVVQRLPIPYVARIFALMPADSVGQILNSLPASYAAALTQEHPELRR